MVPCKVLCITKGTTLHKSLLLTFYSLCYNITLMFREEKLKPIVHFLKEGGVTNESASDQWESEQGR